MAVIGAALLYFFIKYCAFRASLSDYLNRFVLVAAMLSLIVLIAVFLLIAIRQVGHVRLHIWHVMLGGAVLLLVLGQTTPALAFAAVQWEVIFFLFGVFVIGYALEASGYLSFIAHRIFSRFTSVNVLVFAVIVVAGLGSAVLMNDTLAIVGTPVVLYFALRHKVKPQLLLLALAFGVTVGSVMSPIGNPQNLLIAAGSGMDAPFTTFLRHLFLPTVVNLLVTFGVLRLFYRSEFHTRVLVHDVPVIADKALAALAQYSLALLALLIVGKVVLGYVGIQLPLVAIALVACAPILLFSSKRVQVFRSIDWKTIIFFVSMFIVMDAVWREGYFQTMLAQPSFNILALSSILLVSIILSQFISNVPLVALYLPVLLTAGAGTAALVGLAAGSTIAGNLFILGAASNVIIIQLAEEKGHTITFWEFARVGIPLTAINVLVYWVFLTYV
jgi:Na+/H+ antiporter NhaD/arsenite permease-like protein